MRGYFGIGVYHPKNGVNIGTLWRSANNFGASFLFTVGRRYKKQHSDTLKTWRHIPLFHHRDMRNTVDHLPHDCTLIAVEQDENAIDIRAFCHPERAVYLLGAEDNGIPQDVLKMCHGIVAIPTPQCLNVAVAGSIIMYDRIIR